MVAHRSRSSRGEGSRVVPAGRYDGRDADAHEQASHPWSADRMVAMRRHAGQLVRHMTREIAPEDAQGNAAGIAPDIAGDERPSPRGRTAPPERQAAPARNHAAAAPLDHATIRAIVAGIMLAMFLSALEQTIVAPALPAIGKRLCGIDDLSWIVTAYLLAATVATPLFGKLSDMYGRRALHLAAIVIFVAGSVACALAPTIWVLILARALQGIGGGGLLPIAQTIIADLLSPRERPVVQGRTSIMFMSASILGPGALVMTERALRRLPRNDRPHELDVIGASLMVGAALALMLALSWGGVRHPWSSLRIITLIASSGALWVLFALRLLTAREPFIPLAILHGRVTSTITIAAFFSIGTIIGVTIYMPLYCQTVLGVSASLSGLALIAYMGGATLGSLVSTRLIGRIKNFMRVPILGLVVAIPALAALPPDPAGHYLGTVVVLLSVLGLD